MREQVSAHKQLAGGIEFVEVAIPTTLALFLLLLPPPPPQAIPKSAAGKILRKELAAAWAARGA